LRRPDVIFFVLLPVNSRFDDECIGLLSSFENAWVDYFRYADLPLLMCRSIEKAEVS
jgi:hypothetical protein